MSDHMTEMYQEALALSALPAAPMPGVSDAMVEIASAAYAQATGYYVEFHRGLRSESSDKIRRGMRAALSALDVPAHPEGVKDAFDEKAHDLIMRTIPILGEVLLESPRFTTRLNDRFFTLRDDMRQWLVDVADATLSHPEPVAQEPVDERAAFEAWAATEWSNGQGVPHHAWTGWQGRAALRARVAELEARATPPEPWELEAAAIFMDHVEDDETGSVHRVAAFLRAVALSNQGSSSNGQ